MHSPARVETASPKSTTDPPISKAGFPPTWQVLTVAGRTRSFYPCDCLVLVFKKEEGSARAAALPFSLVVYEEQHPAGSESGGIKAPC